MAAADSSSHGFEDDSAVVADFEIHRINHFHVPDLGHIFGQLHERALEFHGDFGDHFNAFNSAEIKFYIFVTAVKFQGIVAGRGVLDIYHGNIKNFFIHCCSFLAAYPYFSRNPDYSQISALVLGPYQEIPDKATIDFFILFCY
jgi:hypothetical protein